MEESKINWEKGEARKELIEKNKGGWGTEGVEQEGKVRRHRGSGKTHNEAYKTYDKYLYTHLPA